MRTATPNDVYTQQAAKAAWQEAINTKFCISYWHSYPERRLHTARRQSRMPGSHQRKIFTSPIGTATPNTAYTQQSAKPACQEAINAKCSHLLLAQLPRTQFTHSTAPNPHARKPSTQNCRISYWHKYQLTQMTQLTHSNAKPACQEDPHARKPSTQNRRISKYCACHADRSRGPPATRRAATLSAGSKYCACHTDRSRGPRRPGAPQPFLDRQEPRPTRRNIFWRLLRLPHKQEPRLTATGAPQPFLILEAPSTARRAATLSGGSKACRTDRSRGPRRPGAATLSGSKYCACRTDRSRGPRRPRAPQPFLDPSTAPAAQTGAAAHSDQARRNPFWRLQVLPATQTGAAEARRNPFWRLQVLRLARRNHFWRLQVLRLAHRQEPRPTATCACGPRRPGAPQPFLEALSTAPARETEDGTEDGR